MKRICLLGSSGQLGYELVRSLSPIAEVISLSREELDLRSMGALIKDKIQRLSPDILINAAAYTAVDTAEFDSAQAFQVNEIAPATMAELCCRLNIPLIHFSTDYVFNGGAKSAWTEEDRPEPLSIYGKSKWHGERAIINSGVDHLILRTSWVYGNHGNNFLNTMKRMAQEKQHMNIVDDQFGAPTWSRHIADSVSQILAMSYMYGNGFWQEKSGVYHLTCGGQCSWYEFACAIFDYMGQVDPNIPILASVKSESYPTPATRPKFSVLDNSKIRNHFGIQLPDWKQSLKLVMQDAGL
jgi:dTDP-4-dehydrorhamnose reductase